jgi:ligand-binding sensor domain-containing protein
MGLPATLTGQLLQYNFKHLGVENGLSNGTIRSLAQDKYGFIWIGTLQGLNRYDGYRVQSWFTEDGQPRSLPQHTVYSLLSDSEGNLWAGTRDALCQYQFATGAFLKVAGIPVTDIDDIKEADSLYLWVATGRGLYKVNKKNRQASLPLRLELQHIHVNAIYMHGGTAWFACRDGLRLYEEANNQYRYISFSQLGHKDSSVLSMMIDRWGYIWISIGRKENTLYKLNPDYSVAAAFPRLSWESFGRTEDPVTDMVEDDQGGIWIASKQRGLLKYDPATNDFVAFSNDNAVENSIANNNVWCLLKDRQGAIWVGTEGNGVDWFYPGRNYFSNIVRTFNAPTTLPANWCRAATEDATGDLWLGTANGLSRYNFRTGKITNLVNDQKHKALYSVSIRSLVTDRQGNVWIGTAAGLNKYDARTGRIDFISEKQGLGKVFVWSLMVDREGILWAATGTGLYRWDSGRQRFDNLSGHPVLAALSGKLVRIIFQDSKGRYWLGAKDAKVYDPAAQTLQTFAHVSGSNSLAGEVVTSFAEDKGGKIWISTFSGISAFDGRQFVNYTRKQGMPSGITAALLVDSLNRVWTGTGNGLCYFDPAKERFTVLDKNDGLCSAHFNEQSAYRMKDGRFLYPTYKGFTIFKPELIQSGNHKAAVYITSFKVLDKEFPANTNPEDIQQLTLEPDQNFFSFELATTDYANTQQSWYSYKLEGLEDQWHFTKDRIATYTNVPGRQYIFLYKVSALPGDVNVEEKQVRVYVKTIFYKSTWFRITMLGLMLAVIYAIYRYRINHGEKLHRLNERATSLEKEKAMAMYENLKQHLNPHFLFNSLTSLNGLIQVDQEKASGFLEQMSQIYRYILRNKETELVALTDELRFVQLYINLLKTRFGAGLNVEIAIAEEHHYRKIAPVTLQNLLENAIKHNKIDTEMPLVINIYTAADYLIVSNNLQKKKFVDTSNRQGLKNMTALYSYLSREAVVVQETTTSFMVKIPLI